MLGDVESVAEGTSQGCQFEVGSFEQVAEFTAAGLAKFAGVEIADGINLHAGHPQA
jgi:hypothetical protein